MKIEIFQRMVKNQAMNDKDAWTIWQTLNTEDRKKYAEIGTILYNRLKKKSLLRGK